MVSKKLKLIPDYGDINNPNIRAKYGYLEASISILGNYFLFLFKLVLGLFINSIALIADAVHTLSDVGTSLVVILGFSISKKPKDDKHPFGYGRVEHIATIIIATSLILVGFGFIMQSLDRLVNFVPIENRELALITCVIMIATSSIKELMARFSTSIGKKIKSNILIADAWHHRSDAFTNIVVGIGIIGSAFGYYILDPIFGVMVSSVIIYAGVELIRTTSNFLIGQAPEKELVGKIEKIAKSVNGVHGIHRISVHDYGTSKAISLHAEVESYLTLDEAHIIADIIENRINDDMNYTTIVRLDPAYVEIDDGISVNKGRNIVKDILENRKEIVSFHKVKIIRLGLRDYIKVHIIVNKNMSIRDSHRLCHDLQSIAQKEYGLCELDIHLEPCAENCFDCKLSCSKRKGDRLIGEPLVGEPLIEERWI